MVEEQTLEGLEVGCTMRESRRCHRDTVDPLLWVGVYSVRVIIKSVTHTHRVWNLSRSLGGGGFTVWGRGTQNASRLRSPIPGSSMIQRSCHQGRRCRSVVHHQGRRCRTHAFSTKVTDHILSPPRSPAAQAFGNQDHQH